MMPNIDTKQVILDMIKDFETLQESINREISRNKELIKKAVERQSLLKRTLAKCGSTNRDFRQVVKELEEKK